MKLQILVPQYNETDAVVKTLLDSIATQQGIDFNEVGVLIANDGSNVLLSDHLLKSYPFKIQYFLDEHRGVSATRNALLDRATADYVMFCDADDMFCYVCGLHIIFKEIDGIHFDTLSSVFLEETKNPETGESVFLKHENDSTFVHGKVHRLGYLRDQNIRWDISLTCHEDGYFNTLCQNLTENKRYCPITFYLWRWRDDSVCRTEKHFTMRTYTKLLDSNTALIRELIKRHRFDAAAVFSTGMIYSTYYTVQLPEWQTEKGKQYKAAAEKRFAEYYREFHELSDSLDREATLQIVSKMRNRHFDDGLILENITFNDWIKEVIKK